MTIEAISDVINVFVPTGLIVVGIWWVLSEGWPYWKKRDESNRQREYDREMAQIAATNMQSEALTVLARAVDSCPFHVVEVEPG